MNDDAALKAAFDGLQTSIDIAKSLCDSDLAFNEAEFKIKLAGLMSTLADAKMNIAETQGIIAAKDNEIKFLKESLDAKKHLKRHNELYYEVDDSGNLTGEPYCSKCWEADYKQIHVNLDYYKKIWVCPNCKNYVKR